MYYVIFSTDVPDSGALRAGARPDHLARLETLKNEGRLLVGRPLPRH